MGNELRFDGRVAIVTGAGNGLGRSHALLLGSRGARVVVNDLGGSHRGEGKSSEAADKVVAEIKALGGDAVANYDSVEDGDRIVQCALDSFGRLDILVNNAGILRDTSFQKMTQADWDLIYRVHVAGVFKTTHAAWNHMRDRDFGRIVMTSSAAGIYGNFGQANYSMAKLGVVGLAQTLAIEGRKKNVLVNTIAPIAGSRMTETVLPKELLDALKPEFVTPLVAYLCHESCGETGSLFEVGGGFIGKLRWQRTVGKSFKLARPLTPEAVAAEWKAITDFSKSTHPDSVNEAMAPVMDNLKTARSKGGNEFIDVDEALGYEFPESKDSYSEKDLALYALAVGAARDALDEGELRTVFEGHRDGFRAIPTFGVIPALNAMFKAGQAPGMNYGFDRILHGEQLLELSRPLPSSGTLTHRARIKEIYDKGKNAVVVTEVRSFDSAGGEVMLNEITAVVRGAGGWGGDRGPAAEQVGPPDRAPDASIEEKTSENQALLYRLTGDINPLHADPSFASAMGFKRPILHGLCSYGFAARHVIKAFAKNDSRFLRSIKARFSDSVFPGETLRTEMWKESDTRILFRTRVVERDAVVISGGVVELFTELPTAKPAARPAAAPAAAAAAPEANSRTSFIVMQHHVESNPELAQKIQTVFQFKLTGPDSSWVIDLKQGKVYEGADPKADVTLEISDADYMDMASGKANPMALFSGGKLKISGNVMASQKLSFMQKMDRDAALKAAIAAGKFGAASAPAAPAPAAGGGAPEANSRTSFIVMQHHVESNPELAQKIQTVFQFKLTGPDASWVIDLKQGKVYEGTDPKADVTLEISDADYMDMASGKANPMALFSGGKLKISGNVMASQKLSFMQKMDRDAALKAAIAAGKFGAASAPAAAAAPAAAKPAAAAKEARTPALFKALAERFASNPGLAAELGGLVQFKVKGPDGAWVIDGKSGAVREGTDAAATTTITASDDDLAALLSGAEPAQSLYQHGKLRVDGDVSPARKLAVLKA